MSHSHKGSYMSYMLFCGSWRFLKVLMVLVTFLWFIPFSKDVFLYTVFKKNFLKKKFLKKNKCTTTSTAITTATTNTTITISTTSATTGYGKLFQSLSQKILNLFFRKKKKKKNLVKLRVIIFILCSSRTALRLNRSLKVPHKVRVQFIDRFM